MSEPVECFMLQVESLDQRFLTFVDNATSTPCSHGRTYHRAQLPIGLEEDLEEAYARLKPITCDHCAYQIPREKEGLSAMRTSYLYTNPKTGNQSTSVYAVATPGAMWECPWMIEDGTSGVLSKFYIEQWLGKRPPICVRCPDGRDWLVDQKSNNGEGWTVTGTAPKLTCNPSIDTGTYHDYLRDGWFGKDLANRSY